jgi:hypothetical protein
LPFEGPIFYEVLKGFRSGASTSGAFESPLFTDAYFTGSYALVGPLTFINPVAINQRPGYFRPAIVMRFLSVELPQDREPMVATDVSRYHGGSVLDEIAALSSLLLDVRLKAGAVNRTFEGDDPLGKPIAWELEPWPPAKTLARYPRLPRAVEGRLLSSEAFTLLDRLDRLTPREANALVKASRSYQEAIWIGEWEPERSWLLLVSAIEAVDNFASSRTASDVDLLKEYNPEIAGPLEKAGGGELLSTLAPRLRVLFGSMRKFCDFILQYLPDEPASRPAAGFQFDWSDTNIRDALKKIYRHRSRALHDGTPFPMPMCQPPIPPAPDGPVIEVPMGLAASTRGGTWMHDETPMLLHVFAHIVRGSIMNWWSSRTLA